MFCCSSSCMTQRQSEYTIVATIICRLQPKSVSSTKYKESWILCLPRLLLILNSIPSAQLNFIIINCDYLRCLSFSTILPDFSGIVYYVSLKLDLTFWFCSSSWNCKKYILVILSSGIIVWPVISIDSNDRQCAPDVNFVNSVLLSVLFLPGIQV